MPFMDERTIKQNIKDKALSGAYLLCGNRPYSVLKYSNAFIKAAVSEINDFNLVRLNGDSLDLNELEEAVNSAPFFADKKCVAINEPDDSKMDKAFLDRFCKILKDVPDTSVVLMYVTGYDIDSGDKKNTHNKFATALSKSGVNVCQFLNKSKSDTASLIQSGFKKNGKTISMENAMYLAEITLSNEGIIENEIDKLSSYTSEPEITLDMINLLVPKNLSVSVFDLTSAIISRNTKKALNILDELLDQKVEAVNIIAVLSNGFMDCYRAKTCQLCSVNIGRAAEDFAYYNRKFALEKASRQTGAKSIEYFRKCIKLLKKASIDFFTATVEEKQYLETLIVKLALLGN